MIKNTVRGSLFFIAIFISFKADGQSSFSTLKPLFTIPNNYTATYSKQAPVIDGNLNDTSWQQAPWTEKFVDIEGEGHPLPSLFTRAKMLWNDSCLFIAAEVQESDIFAYVKKHDEIVFLDNDFEIFIDPNNQAKQYFEIEVNATNNLFDLFLSKPYRNSSGALFSWNAAGIKAAVKIHGTLNNGTDRDTSWTVEMAIPFSALTIGNDVKIPAEGDTWRINFSRVEWDTGFADGRYIKKTTTDGKRLPEHNWVWSPQGVIDMHYPERWGYLRFTKKSVKESPKFELPFAEKQKQYLWLVYYKQKKYFEQYHRYAAMFADLGIKKLAVIDNQLNSLMMEATTYQFTATIQSTKNSPLWSINEDGLIKVLDDK